MPELLKRHANISARIFKLIPLLALTAQLQACYSYAQLRCERKVSAAASDQVPSLKEAGEFDKAAALPLSFIFSSYRKLCLMRSSSPCALINNSGVQAVRKGRFTAAQSLFSEAVLDPSGRPAASNNLGILYELSGNREMAFMMYSQACMSAPGNSIFRKNFQSFLTGGRKGLIVR